MPDTLQLPDPCLVVLVGASSSGKSTWAAGHFRTEQVVSSDRLRAVVGEDERDQEASADAFALLDSIVTKRLGRRLTTVIDTVGLDDERRHSHLELARAAGMPAFLVVFEVPIDLARARNRERIRRVPDKVLVSQLRRFRQIQPRLAGEGWDRVLQPQPVEMTAAPFHESAPAAGRQRENPVGLRFGLIVSSFSWPGGPSEIAQRLAEIAKAAEETGFSSLWVMDHFIQLPQIGPDWSDLLDSYTALGYLAAATERINLGVLVTGVTFRNLAHLGKIVATLDVLSGGRAWCGLGAASFEREHRAYGWRFPSAKERLDLLEDALRLLPLMWGPGAPAFEGKVVSVPEAICYPRPLQKRVPILVGGGGERRTLKLVARYADACNVFGRPDRVHAKVEVLRQHCQSLGRPFEEIEVTHLSTTLSTNSPVELDAAVESLRPRRESSERFRSRVNAGTVVQQVGRFRMLAEAGVQHAIISLPDLADGRAVHRFEPVISAFGI